MRIYFKGIAVLQHLTRVTKNLDIGTEFLYQANPMMPGRHIGITSFVARYRGEENFLYLNSCILFYSNLRF
jgi:hypothetical protein